MNKEQSNQRIQAFASVEVVLTVSYDQPWGSTSTVQEIENLARDNAKETIIRVMNSLKTGDRFYDNGRLTLSNIGKVKIRLEISPA